MNDTTLPRRLAATAFLAASFCGAAAFAQQQQPQQQGADVDVRAGSVLRAGPSVRHPVVHRVTRTESAEVFGCTEQRGWCEVQMDDSGARGWVGESRLLAVQEEEEGLDHRTGSTPLMPQRGAIDAGAVSGVYLVQPWNYGYYGGGATVIEMAPRGGPGEPIFPMRPGWARGQPMPR